MANTAAYSGLRWGELQLTQDTGAQQVSRRSGRHRTATSNREGYPGRHGNDGNAVPGPHKPPPPLRHEHPAA
jgi:hypothetical protein